MPLAAPVTMATRPANPLVPDGSDMMLVSRSHLQAMPGAATARSRTLSAPSSRRCGHGRCASMTARPTTACWRTRRSLSQGERVFALEVEHGTGLVGCGDLAVKLCGQAHGLFNQLGIGSQLAAPLEQIILKPDAHVPAHDHGHGRQ